MQTLRNKKFSWTHGRKGSYHSCQNKKLFPDTLKEDKILPYKWRETIKHTAFTHRITGQVTIHTQKTALLLCSDRRASRYHPQTEKQVTIHTQETCNFPAQRRISSYCANKEEKAHSIHSQKAS